MECRQPSPFAEQGKWVQTPAGSTEAALPLWCRDPRARHEGPWSQGVTGAADAVPVQQKPADAVCRKTKTVSDNSQRSESASRTQGTPQAVVRSTEREGASLKEGGPAGEAP